MDSIIKDPKEDTITEEPIGPITKDPKEDPREDPITEDPEEHPIYC